MMSAIRILIALGALLTGVLGAASAHAMGSAFAYQGTLEDQGQPAHGLYDFQFRLLNSNFNAIGLTNTFPAQPVSQGVFTVELDFGPNVNLYPGEFVRYLEIGIRPAGSADPFEVLAPLTPLHPVPYARRAEAVNPAAINNTALADLAVSNRVLNDNAVNNRVLSTNAVQTVNIQNGAVNGDKLADNSVTNAKIANGAVNNAKIASNTITLNRMAGAVVQGPLSLNVAANSCVDFNIGVAGAQVGDIPFLAMQSSGALPANLTLVALRVVSAGTVQARCCNHGNVSRSFTDLPVFAITLR